MAAKTPVAYGDSNWLDPSTSTAEWSGATTTVVPNTVPGRHTVYFDDIDTTDTYALTGWYGPAPVTRFVHANALDMVATSSAVSGSTLTVTFVAQAVNNPGHLIIEPTAIL